jgi:hypothetical protein
VARRSWLACKVLVADDCNCAVKRQRVAQSVEAAASVGG